MSRSAPHCDFICHAAPALLAVVLVGCAPPGGTPTTLQPEAAGGVSESQMDESIASEDAAPLAPTPETPAETASYAGDRERMVANQLVARDIIDERVLAAMGRVPRHLFVPDSLKPFAYNDSPLPIGEGQTISQPYIVALMTQLVTPRPNAKALDVGTGSGYQAAVLAELVEKVYSIEIVEPLAQQAKTRLQTLEYKNIEVRAGDGYRGWPEQAPFDIIIVAAAPGHVPQPLEEQLAPGGKMVIPVGGYFQELMLIEKALDGTLTRRSIAPVAFVPMTGEAAK